MSFAPTAGIVDFPIDHQNFKPGLIEQEKIKLIEYLQSL